MGDEEGGAISYDDATKYARTHNTFALIYLVTLTHSTLTYLLTYSLTQRANVPRILFTGPRRSGKSSIESGT